jgi:cobalt-zinc-cadmium efflux system membrane fusion protein
MKELVILIFSILFLTSLSGCARNDKSSAKIVERAGQSNFVDVTKEAIKSIGIKVEPAEVKKVTFYLKYNGIVKEIPSKTFYVASPVKGRVENVFVEQNQVVSKGQKLAGISSHDIAEIQLDLTEKQIGIDGEIEKAKLELNLAETNYLREKELFESRIVPKKDFLEAENNYKIAMSNLEILEKRKGSFENLAQKRLTILGAKSGDSQSESGYVDIVARHGGILLKRNINPGEVVDENTVLFEASDLSEIFLESNVYEKDLSEIMLGGKVAFYPEAFPDKVFNGEISYIGNIADPNTRTIPVRAKINNTNNTLKPEIFGKMLIGLAEKETLVISKKAVQRIDNKSVVYIKAKNGFKEIPVQVGKETDGLVEILEGLKQTQKVVTEGSYWLKCKLHNIYS